MSIPQDRPIVFTTDGNVYEDELNYSTNFEFVSKKDGTLREIHCQQFWHRKDTGALVKKAVTTYLNELLPSLGADLG